MNNNILDFFKRTSRLMDIDRCSNIAHIKPYSVAIHSYYIALYSMIFADLENERIISEENRIKGRKLGSFPKLELEDEIKHRLYNISILLQKSLLHDLEESETGDVLYPLHTNNPEFKKALDEIRKKCVDTIVFKELPDNLRKLYIKLWQEAKDETKEGILVAAMDKFEILMYAIREIDLGNKGIRGLYNNAIIILKNNFNIPSLNSVILEIENKYGFFL